MNATPSLQRRYAPHNACFGCGPANEKGLRLESVPEGESCVCTWTSQKHHEAFEGMLNGGILGTLLDCHSNWTAAWALMRRAGSATPPCTVTAEFHVRLRRPTPSLRELRVEATPTETSDDRCVVEARILCDGQVTATCRGVFVAVREGHPAYHRW